MVGVFRAGRHVLTLPSTPFHCQVAIVHHLSVKLKVKMEPKFAATKVALYIYTYIYIYIFKYTCSLVRNVGISDQRWRKGTGHYIRTTETNRATQHVADTLHGTPWEARYDMEHGPPIPNTRSEYPAQTRNNQLNIFGIP